MDTIQKTISAWLMLLMSSCTAGAAADPNEVGAMLIFPAILADGYEDECEECDYEGQAVAGPGAAVRAGTGAVAFEQENGDAVGGTRFFHSGMIETFATITNAGPTPVTAHVSFINGDESDDDYCGECDFSIQLTGNDTETINIRPQAGASAIRSEDGTLVMSCPFEQGMLLVTQEAGGATLTENVLLGEQVVVDYGFGQAFSIPAIPVQGISPDGNGRNYAFDGVEFAKLPRVVAADFLAPSNTTSVEADLILFTPGFDRDQPPVTDCTVTGFDAHENPFSASFQFGCWTVRSLCDISSEFCHPNLGLVTNGDTHGWLQANCRVDSNPGAGDGFDALGGVHGAIVQSVFQGGSLAAGSGASFQSTAAWGRLLYQSVTAGDALTLHLAPSHGGMF